MRSRSEHLWLCAAWPASASAQVYILTISGPIAGGGHQATIRPRTIKLYSGAGLRRLRWSAWGGPRARAKGTEYDTDTFTTPYSVLKDPVAVMASNPTLCGAIRVYRKLHVHFTRGVPQGMPRDATYHMRCPD